MNKQTIAYILIGAGVLAAIYYFVTKSKSNASALGAGLPDTRGAWASDDDATYDKMRNRVMAHKDKYDGAQALGWIDPGVQEKYEAGPSSYLHNIKGKDTKAGAFLSVMEAINPHPDGKFTGNKSGGKTQLFPDSLLTALWMDFNALKVKYGGL